MLMGLCRVLDFRGLGLTGFTAWRFSYLRASGVYVGFGAADQTLFINPNPKKERSCCSTGDRTDNTFLLRPPGPEQSTTFHRELGKLNLGGPKSGHLKLCYFPETS